jgi:hypothetical protein
MSGYTINATGQLNLGSSTGVVRFDSDCSFSNPSQVRRETAPAKLVHVDSLADLPDPSGNVITLEPGTCYHISNRLDLAGNRLVTADAENTIKGSSSETSWLTSTGLPAGEPLITSEYTLPIQNLSVHAVDTAFDISGTDVAIDWKAFNIIDCSNLGTFGNCANIILESSAYLGCQNMVIDGEVGTFGTTNVLWTGNFGRSGDNIIHFTENATITRRARLTYSSIVTPSGSVGLFVDPSASIPTGGYILDTINFSGPGSAIGGLGDDADACEFRNSVGVLNRTDKGQLYVQNTTAYTQTGVDGSYVDLEFSADNSVITLSDKSFHFTQDPSNLTQLIYNGSTGRSFMVSVNYAVSGGSTREDYRMALVTTHDAVETVQVASARPFTSPSQNVFASITLNDVVDLEPGDKVRIQIKTDDATTQSILNKGLNFLVLEN